MPINILESQNSSLHQKEALQADHLYNVPFHGGKLHIYPFYAEEYWHVGVHFHSQHSMSNSPGLPLPQSQESMRWKPPVPQDVP